MDVDPYRLAYNVLHCNWIKFGIPQDDIPPPKTEKVDSLDPIIPGFSTAVVLFQIASRKDLKSFLDEECPTVHNLYNVFERFINIMRNAQPEDTILINSPNDEDLFQDTIEEYFSGDSLEADLPKDIKKENLPNDAMKEELMVDIVNKKSLEDVKEGVVVDTVKEGLLVEESMKENLLHDDIKENLPEDYKKAGFLENAKKGPKENIVHSEDIPGLIAYSLAICTELALYERKIENNKEYMKVLPEMWEEYFDKNLKLLCKKVRYTQEHLEDYSKSMKCLEEFLNKFISENKNEYNGIADMFYGYTETHVATLSPEHSKLKTEVRNLSKGTSFLKIKKMFAALKEICKCLSQNLKGEMASDQIPLLTDYSPSTPTSPLH